MASKWYKLKNEAVRLRKRGSSIRKIESRLKIPRSTLSCWFRNIELSAKQKEKLHNDWKNALIKARKKAVLWHNAQKEKRFQIAKKEAESVIKNINMSDFDILELALAILYFGEGSKKNIETALGNSDPLVLKFFILILRNIYHLSNEKIRCELYLRADQNPEKIKRYWAKALKLPLNNFKQINIDKRTAGSKTYSNYKGVCNVRCGNVAIKRKLIYLAKMFFDRVLYNNYMRP